MVRPISHDRHKKKQRRPWLKLHFTDLDESIRYLIDWLNNPKEDAFRKARVRELWVAAGKLSRLSRPSSGASSRAMQECLEQINSRLAQHKAIRTVFASDRGIRTVWGLPFVKLSDALRKLTPERMTELEQSREYMMTHILTDALEHGSLAKIGFCECGRFFFARFSLARFCSAKCRIAFWESLPERKAQKRENARKYYRLHKTKNTK
jgi:hypothetical protein